MRMASKTSGLLAICMTALVLFAACATGGEDDSPDMQTTYPEDKGEKSGTDGADPIQLTVYDGEWTVNKQVVDTARLEMSDRVRLRLPEAYLMRLCFPDKSDAAEPKGVHMEASLILQGYTEQMSLCSFMTLVYNGRGLVFYGAGYFYVTMDGSDYRIDVLCEESANAIFRKDTQLWTIGIPVIGFLVTNTGTNEKQEILRSNPVTIYYNAKQRIR